MTNNPTSAAGIAKLAEREAIVRWLRDMAAVWSGARLSVSLKAKSGWWFGLNTWLNRHVTARALLFAAFMIERGDYLKDGPHDQ